MSAPPLEDRAGISPELRGRIEEAIADHGLLDRVVKWGLSSDPQRIISNVVVQDEYTHDVVLPWGDGLFLVYDCT